MSAARPSLCSVCHDSTASTMLLKLPAAACAEGDDVQGSGKH